MIKFRFRPFWSYDVLKTQNWLDKKRKKGYKLRKINSILRIFFFEKVSMENSKHLVFYAKGLKGYPKKIIDSIDYDQVCYTKNFYVIDQMIDNPHYIPTYDQILSRNQKIKMVAGYILLIIVFMYVFDFMILLLLLIFSNGDIVVTESVDETPTNIKELFLGLLSLIGFSFMFIWPIYSFFKLRKSNKRLEFLCGEEISLSFTVPTDTILLKEDIKQLKSEKRLIKKRRIAWFYSPDKCENWLQKMEQEGFNLIRMSKIGNSFYFVKGIKRNMKYHVDFQKKKNTTYYKLNKESGWKLYFTSIGKFLSISVWGQEDIDNTLEYYSDIESKVKHAKSFMLVYIVWMLPMTLFYFFVFAFSLYNIIKQNFIYANSSMILVPIIFFLGGCEFLWFSLRLIKYYYRQKRLDY